MHIVATATASRPPRPGRAARRGLPGVVLATVLATSPALADRSDVSARMRDLAIDRCKSDALRLCPFKMFDKSAVVHCLAGKRSSLSPSCRKSYDAVAHALRR